MRSSSRLQVLIERIRDLFGGDVTFDPHGGQVWINLPDGEADVTYFGQRAELMQQLMAVTGLELADATLVAWRMFDVMVDHAVDGHPIPFSGTDGFLIYPSGGRREVARQLVRAAECDQ